MHNVRETDWYHQEAKYPLRKPLQPAYPTKDRQVTAINFSPHVIKVLELN